MGTLRSVKGDQLVNSVEMENSGSGMSIGSKESQPLGGDPSLSAIERQAKI
jgi:hypothetical protein